MLSRRSPTVVCYRLSVAIVFLVSLFSLASAEQPTPAQVEDQSTEQESLDVRYARALLKLAKLDLNRFLAAQRRFPNLLPIEAGADLERHVAINEEQLKQAIKGSDGDTHQIYIRSALNAVENAEKDLKRKREVYKQFPTKTQAFAVQRAEAALELAELRLEITRTKQAEGYSMMYLQWQIEMLRNQVLELQLQVKAEMLSE